mmetsp:Transcript_22064/g.61054  ORF Transcript_22064/g.61054 Transcript_22064/m.61054 type:complete len:349 (-) Transcript_22064:195-1241(-)
MRIRRDELQDVVRRGRTRAAAALADWQGSVVVEEENHLAIPVAQADPLGGSLAVVLTAVVLTDVSLALGNPSEPGLPPGDGEGPAAVDEAVVPGEAPVPRVPEDAARVVALLEAHQVVLLGAACLGDLPAGALAVAMPLAEQVPPEEVVGKDLEIRGSASGRAGLEVPALRRDAHLAPGACALQRGGGAPADDSPRRWGRARGGSGAGRSVAHEDVGRLVAAHAGRQLCGTGAPAAGAHDIGPAAPRHLGGCARATGRCLFLHDDVGHLVATHAGGQLCGARATAAGAHGISPATPRDLPGRASPRLFRAAGCRGIRRGSVELEEGMVLRQPRLCLCPCICRAAGRTC